MKKIVRLTESDLVRIVKKVISEQSMTPKKMEGRNNPSWIKLVSTLKNLPYPPRVLTFNSYDDPSIPSQSLNWGTAKGANGVYAFTIPSTDSKMPKELMFLFDSEDRNKQMEMHKWWKQKGYQTDGNEISIRFDDADRLKSDILSFFKSYPPIK